MNSAPTIQFNDLQGWNVLVHSRKWRDYIEETLRHGYNRNTTAWHIVLTVYTYSQVFWKLLPAFFEWNVLIRQPAQETELKLNRLSRRPPERCILPVTDVYVSPVAVVDY